MPRAILFDLDGTLWDRSGAVRALLTLQHQEGGKTLAHVAQRDYVERVLQLDANGTADKKAVYQLLGAEFGLPEPLINDLYTDFWSRYESFYRPFPEVIDTLRELRRIGVKLGIITNGSIRVQEPKMDRMGLADLMDVILISEREGIRKPEAEIFHRALARAGVPSSEGWFIGDHPDVDVAGAQAAGLRAFWRECADWPSPTVPCGTIQSLDELLPLISRSSRQK